MEKKCSNCTYLYKSYNEEYSCPKHTQLKIMPNEICKYHLFNCAENNCKNEASCIYEEKPICFDCLIDKFNVKEHVTSVYYNEDGEYLGSSEDCNEVIENLCNDDIKPL